VGGASPVGVAPPYGVVVVEGCAGDVVVVGVGAGIDAPLAALAVPVEGRCG